MKNSKRKLKKLPPNIIAENNSILYLTLDESKLLGFKDEGNKQQPYIVLKYYQKKFECFSEWTAKELKEFSVFNEKLTSSTWGDIHNSASKTLGYKTGFGYTIHKNKDILPNQDVLEKLSADLTYFELRVNDKLRVHGFRIKAAFCLLWLDREHKIYKD